MLKKILLAAVVVVAVLIVTGYLFRDQVFMALAASQLSPEHDFSPDLAPPAPDYGDPAAWAALPSTSDPSDDHPAGLERHPTGVAVFFVHPTSFFGRDNWNQPLGAEQPNWVVDQRVLRHQASVFNGCCDVYAPRYRQATIFSFIDRSGSGERALDFAYQDVADAFEAFLDRIAGRPFILAGHSQGSFHGARLLRERIAGTPLEKSLVAAYLIGYAVEKDQTGGIPSCDHASATGCVVGWNAVDGDGDGLFPDAGALVCTNPLTWEDNGSYAGHDLNDGGVGYPSYGPPADGEDVTAMPVEVGVADAECRDGNLIVPELRSDAFPSRMQGNSMHVYDYSLFYLNLRTNAQRRAEAFMSGQRAAL